MVVGGGRLPPRFIPGGASHARPVGRSRRHVVDRPGVLRFAAGIIVIRGHGALAHGGSHRLSLPTPSLAIWPANACKKQSARGRYVNEPLIAPLDPRHHPSIHPSINGSQGGRSLAWLRDVPKLLGWYEAFEKLGRCRRRDAALRRGESPSSRHDAPLLVGVCLLGGHNRQSMSLTVVLVIPQRGSRQGK